MKALLALAFAVTTAITVGCGGAVYAIEVNSAASKVSEARELGAEKLAPYEYYYASEYLSQARVEASEGDYSDAIDFANVAEESAEKAIKLSKEAHRGAGR
jgi:hypothetical protein